MKKKALRKDFYIEIKRSLGRFLSIFFIVALGVSFFSGIRAAEPDMRLSGDEYFDEHNLADMKVISTFGLTDGDVKALEKVEGVQKAEYGYSVDAVCKIDDSKKVIHVMSALPTMNRAEVHEGRMPETQNECFVDIDFLNGSGYKVGDEIQLESGTDDPLTDSLRNETYKIVGAGSSPCYISFERGSSTLGTGEVSGFMIVAPEAFAMEVYTECYLTIDEAIDEIAFTKGYTDKVDSVMERVEGIKDIRCKARRDDITAEAEDKIAEAEAELAEGRQEAEEELAEALLKLLDGEEKLVNGRNELETGRQELANAKSMLNTKQKELDDAKSTLNAKQGELVSARTQYESGAARLEAAKAEFALKEREFAAVEAQIPQLQAGIQALEGQLAGEEALYKELGEELAGLDESDPNNEGAITDLKNQMAVHEAAITEITNQLVPLKANLEGINAGRQALEAGRTEIAVNEAQLDGVRQQLDEGQAQIDAGYAQITSGQTQINQGWAEIRANENKLTEAENTIAVSQQELLDGRAEYEKGKAEAEAEIADGEQKIADAKKELKDIGMPKWYVYDRDVFTQYSGYGDNADRMRAIGEVFPVLFFLVAALISLTTMTRMVEEQRTQIGTLKALGYSKFSIAGKYLGYAFVATLGGSVVGILAGEKLYPYIIVTAYKIMYIHIPNVVIPYNITYAVMAALAAVACTMTATVLACYKEMAAQPAVLMRPPAPKQGKRVFLEKVTFIWKRLNFTWKSTIRNLIRYKKRFFMTIFGIGGCMALLLVGYGLRDSIFNIAVIQYEEIQQYNMMAVLDEDASEEEKQLLAEYIDGEKSISDMLDIYIKNMPIGKGRAEENVYVFVSADEEKFHEFVELKDRRTDEKCSLTNDGAVLTEKIAKTLGVDVGDSVIIKDEELGEREIKVVGICENYMGHYLYMTAEAYESLYGNEPAYNSKLFKMKDYETKEANRIGEEMLGTKAVINVQYMNNMRGQIEDMLTTLDSVIIVLIAAAGMLAFVVLYNLNNINITERRRELATIKVLGFFDTEVAAYVYRENILLTVIGAVAGCGMGFLLHQFVIVTVEVDDVMFGRNIDLKSYIIALLFTFGFSAFVNWVMYFKLKKINMVESLKSVE